MYKANIVDLITDFFSNESLQNFFCKVCNRKCSAVRHTTIVRAPTVLIMQLKRFNPFGGKNRLNVRTNMFLNLTKFTSNQAFTRYRLNGIIEHLGSGMNFGHYVCAMRGFNDNEWFKFDDSETSTINEQTVIEKMEPYILFYTRIPPKSPTPNYRLSLNNIHQRRPQIMQFSTPPVKQSRFSQFDNRSFHNNTFSSYAPL